MEGGSDHGSETRSAAYVDSWARVVMPIDKVRCTTTAWAADAIERKSDEPMAAVTAPAQVAAEHQSLLHFVGNAPWSDSAMLAKVRAGAAGDPATADRGLDHRRYRVSQKGAALGRVTRQYCGQLGKQATAKSRYRCRWPITMPARRSPAAVSA